MEDVDRETETELEELKNELERTLGKDKLRKKLAMAESERTAVRWAPKQLRRLSHPKYTTGCL